MKYQTCLKFLNRSLIYPATELAQVIPNVNNFKR